MRHLLVLTCTARTCLPPHSPYLSLKNYSLSFVYFEIFRNISKDFRLTLPCAQVLSSDDMTCNLSAPNRTETLVNRFVHQCQKLLPSTSSYFVIPTSIIQIVVLYCVLIEEFVIFGDEMECSDDNQTIDMKNPGTWNSAFGTIKIEYFKNMVYEWILELRGSSSTLCIGIIFAEDLDTLKNGTAWDVDVFYGFHSRGFRIIGKVVDDHRAKFGVEKEYCCVKIRLDWNENVLTLFKGDDYKQEVKCDNIDPSKVYNLAVCMSGGLITIKKFTMTTYS